MADEKTEDIKSEQPADDLQDAPIELLPEPAPKPKPADKPDADRPDGNESALAYQLRQEKKRAAQLEEDNKKYKKREEEERKAKQTEQEQRDEDLIAIREERDALKRENLITRVGIDAKLPKSMWSRIQGADEDAMRADAEDLAALVKKSAVGTITDPVREGAGKPRKVTRAQLQADPKMAREAAAKLASGEWVLVSS